ncbi:RNA-guided endonuclease InsQ/TnpB family protein [Streptomyces mirabilis]|uniref:RNA-guided endonuclease InsQ/TnpB family protein n=1 Tax=Streptomyces mirabilis TaxID=68239 RepID=UPI00224D4FE2|nr:RNA-guided endonuclease TnpB family protein [Streptomyces mirabilis]MCX4419390.1 RNA-guided endonuclease TnpB family protein [Streptomyces mirabilis]
MHAGGEIRTVTNPGHYDQARKRLRRASRVVSRRQGPDRRTGQKPSKRWEKANAHRNKVHHRVANLREDALHKLTTAVAAEYSTIVIEDLNVAGMLRNRRLARRIADAGFGEIRRQLAYKTSQRHATRIVVADRWYPSSKTCSGCGAVKAKLPLHVRTYECDACNLVIDRDDNAALNLAALAAAAVTGTGVAGDQDTAPAVSKPRGADQKTRATRPRRKAEAGRAGNATCSPRCRSPHRTRSRCSPSRLRGRPSVTHHRTSATAPPRTTCFVPEPRSTGRARGRPRSDGPDGDREGLAAMGVGGKVPGTQPGTGLVSVSPPPNSARYRRGPCPSRRHPAGR